MFAAKPILGFGPIGWIATVVLAALLVAIALGVDLQYHYLLMLNRVVGGDGFWWYLHHIHILHGMAMRDADFSTISILYVIVAFRIVPRRMGWWRYAIVIACGLIIPVIFRHLHFLIWPRLRFLYLSAPGGTNISPILLMAIFALAMCAILGILCRSWRVFLMCASATIAAYGMESLLFVNGMNDALLAAAIGPFWHLCMAGTLLWWAIRERLRADGSRCLWCGYDLRGAAHEHCPECGNVPVQLLKIQSA